MVTPPAHRLPLAATAQDVAAGFAQVRHVTDGDGALDAGTKSLLLATAAAAQRDPELLAHEVARVDQLGVEAARVWAAGAVLASSRGEGAYATYAAAVRQAVGEPAGTQRVADEGVGAADAHAEAVSFLSRATGALPAYAVPLDEHAPQALIGYAQTLQAAWSQPAVTAAEVQLILVVINVAGCLPDFAAHHSRLARQAGASDAQVVEAGVCAIPSGGVTAWYASGASLLSA